MSISIDHYYSVLIKKDSELLHFGVVENPKENGFIGTISAEVVNTRIDISVDCSEKALELSTMFEELSAILQHYENGVKEK